MIYDTIANRQTYGYAHALDPAFQFIANLNPGCPIGNYPISGGSVFAKVMRLQTKPLADTVCEAHRKYVDLQVVLSGEEYIDWYAREPLTTRKAYDPDNDVELFETPDTGAPLRLKLIPGSFVLFFPQDAHAPLLTTGDGPQTLKKVVIKIELDLFGDAFPG